MRVLVIGASGGSGRAATQALLARGCEVSALVRHPDAMPLLHGPLTLVQGDATCASDLDHAMAGHDAVVVTLGIRENPVRVRLLGSAHTPMNVRSQGTQLVVQAMRRHGVGRLVVQSSYGVGATRHNLPLAVRMMFALLLKPQIQDTERQEALVRASGLDWVLVQPVSLTNDHTSVPAFASAEGGFHSMKVSRQQVGQFLAEAAMTRTYSRQSVALSGEPVSATRAQADPVR